MTRRTLVGLAGSVTTVAALALGLDVYDAGRIHHARIGAGQVHEQTARLLAQPQAGRARLGVMHPGRVDVIGGGALVLDGIMTRFGFAEVLASEHDILDGIAWSLAHGRADRDGWARPRDPGRARCRPAPAGRMTPPPPRLRWPTTRRRCAPSPPGRARWPSWSPGSPSAGPARGWSNGGSRWRPSSGASSRGERYWGRPIPGWGDERPAVLIVGLAPAAHGGNRTGRIFTGDRSGDVLFASLYRCGLAAQPASIAAGDGQRLIRARMVAAVRCAPPANKPTVTERDTCAPWLAAEFARVAGSARVVVCLGALRLAGDVAAAALGRVRAAPAPARRSAMARRPGSPAGKPGGRPGRCSSAATTPASRTRSPAG